MATQNHWGYPTDHQSRSFLKLNHAILRSYKGVSENGLYPSNSRTIGFGRHIIFRQTQIILEPCHAVRKMADAESQAALRQTSEIEVRNW